MMVRFVRLEHLCENSVYGLLLPSKDFLSIDEGPHTSNDDGDSGSEILHAKELFNGHGP